MTPDQYCQKKVLNTGSSLYYSLLYVPDAQRRAAAAIHAFCRETGDIIPACSDTAIARAKLDWWRSEMERCFRGQAQHPVSQALQQPLQTWNLPQEYFSEILDGVQMDLQQHHYATFSELALYCYRVAGIKALLSAEIYGYSNRHTPEFAQSLGTALQLTALLRDVRTHAQQGRLYIPLETLQTFDVDPELLLLNTGTEKLQALFASLAQQASDYFDQAARQLADEDRYAQHPGLIQAAIYTALLDEIGRDNYRLLEQRLSLTPLRKFWIAWKTHRRERKRYAA